MIGAQAALFVPAPCCWICGAADLVAVHDLIFELAAYRDQDPELATYSGCRLSLCQCRECGFGQPAALPELPRFFDRMYDQRWSAAWIEAEFESTCKDYIFSGVLAALATRVPHGRRRLLDVGAHAGRFVSLAVRAGWAAEGLELNPQTAAYAAERTGRPIHRMNVRDFARDHGSFDAVVLTDVLEHIAEPIGVLEATAALLAPGGCLAVKVPHGPSQLRKEEWRARLRPSYRPTVADNLVHVNHFSPASLRLALERSGFEAVEIRPGAPELPRGRGIAGAAGRVIRLAAHGAASLLPGGVHAPITFNLQAYARRP
jgi:SAM-dependent methyltransferase